MWYNFSWSYMYYIITVQHRLHIFCSLWYKLPRAICPTVWICESFVPIHRNILNTHTVGFTDQNSWNFEIVWGAGNLSPLRPVPSHLWKNYSIDWLAVFLVCRNAKQNFQRFKHATLHASKCYLSL
jgi:hypothetical protein